MELYPSGQFGYMDDLDCQFGNGLDWTWTRTRSDGPEPLLTLACIEEPYTMHGAVAGKSVSHHHRHSAWRRTELRRVYKDTGMMETDWAMGAYGDQGWRRWTE